MSDTSTSCQAYDASLATPYGYVPSLAIGLIFCVVFSVSIGGHIVQSIIYRQWWLLMFALGGVGETIGWAARTWSSKCPYNFTAFQIQLSTLIISPSFFTAGIYVILHRFASSSSTKSIIPPAYYLYIFCTCDLISLGIQAVGGGMAAIAVGQVDGDPKNGTNIMVIGVIFQMVSLSVFVGFFVAEIFRAQKALTTKNLQVLIASTAGAVLLIYLRGGYRTVELLEGWTGYLITHEIFFVILDGVMMVLTGYIFNIFNPASLLMAGNPDGQDQHDVRSYQMF